MPAPWVALDSSDEDEDIKPLRSLNVRPRTTPNSDSEFDQLESDAEDELVETPSYFTRSGARKHRPEAAGDGSRAKRNEEIKRREENKRRKREKAKEEKRKRRKAEKKAAISAASQNGDRNGHSRPGEALAASASSTITQDPNGMQRSQAVDVVEIADDDDDAPLPSLTVQPATQEQTHASSAPQPQPMSEDEVELIASQPSEFPSSAASATTRSSSVPILTDSNLHEAHSQRAASATPQATTNASGSAAAPIQVASSDAPHQSGSVAQPDDLPGSDVSSVEITDSDEFDSQEEFYTSSEGSLHGSDSEEGLGHWNEYDQEHWQGSTAHLDDAYNGDYVIRAVLRHRKHPRRGFLQYRTVWRGYPLYSSTWEQESNFNQAKTIRDYWKRQGGRPADAIEDPFDHSAHDSDTDVAINRRPRQRAHEAKKKKRLDIRRDRVQLRQFERSLNEETRAKYARREEEFAQKRRERQLTLETTRLQEKGSSRGQQRRLEKLAQKKWQRSAGAAGSNAAGPSRHNATRTDRNLGDISMKARAGASRTIAARTRVSQLNDSILEDDENQMVFRRSGPNYPGLSTSMAPIRDRPGMGYGSVRPSGVPPSSSTAGPSSATPSQAPAARPPPGSYKGAHRREPKVQMRQDFGNFLNRLHGGGGGGGGARPGSANSSTAPPLQAPTDSNGRSISTTARRSSEVKKPNLLVLKPVENFQGGSRAAPSGPAVPADSSASSDAGDNDAFGIPEMSAVRSQFNPRQPVPEDEGQVSRDRQASGSSSAAKDAALKPKQVSFAQSGPSQPVVARSPVEDPRRRPAPAASSPQHGPAASWSPDHEDGQWSPQDSGYFTTETASNGGRSPMPPSPAIRSPLHGGSNNRGPEAHQSRVPRRLIWNGWFDFDVRHNHIETEGALFATEGLSADRIQALGLTSSGGTVCFNMYMPFALIRDLLIGQSTRADDVLLLHAHGLGAPQARSSVDQLSEQLKALDVALFAYAGEAPVTGQASGPKDYFVAFSSKYVVDHITGVPPSLREAIGQPYTVCVIPLQLDHHPAPSSHISFDQLPRLDADVDNVFGAAIGKKAIDDLNIGSNEIRKLKLAAQRYGVSTQIYKDMRSKYNVIFQGANPLMYEKGVIYYMVRIFEGGARLGLDPEKDAQLWKDAKHGTNIFVRRAAFQQMLSSDQTTDGPKAPLLAPFLRRLKRQPRCTFFLYGFSSVDLDERITEFFPGRSGLVTFTFSTILADLLRSSMADPEQDPLDKEEGQLTQTDKTPPDSILCNAAFHLADHWKVRIHPWVRTCFKLLADHLEPVCRALHLIGEDQEFPIELMLELDSKLETLYTSALCEEWSVDAISGLPFEEPTEVSDEPAELVRRIDDEVLATLRKAQMFTSHETRFHVLVSQGEVMSEEQLAGIEKISLNEFGADKCRELARLPGN